jgi:hypothetical protein
MVPHHLPITLEVAPVIIVKKCSGVPFLVLLLLDASTMSTARTSSFAESSTLTSPSLRIN